MQRLSNAAGSSPRAAHIVSVAVPVPALDLLSYEVPKGLPLPKIGARVLVPLGTRVVTGCVVERTADPVGAALKPLVDVLDTEPMLPAEVVDLAPLGQRVLRVRPGEAVAAAMPPRAWVASERQAQITDIGRAALHERPGATRRAVLEALGDGTAALSHNWGAGSQRGAGGQRGAQEGCTHCWGRWLAMGW